MIEHRTEPSCGGDHPGAAVDGSYWEARLRQNWNLRGVGHINYGKHYNWWLYKVRRYVFEHEMNRLIRNWSQIDVLDVGSGTGFWIDLWKSLGVHSVVGSDITQVAVERLRQAHPDSRFVKLDISDSPECQNLVDTFHVISAFDVLFHITSDVQFSNAVSNIFRLLTPGGYFIFSDNFLHGQEVRSEHQANRTLNQISDVLCRVGFRVVKRVPMFVLMNTPIDFPFELSRDLWRLMMAPVKLVPALGHLYGATLFPLEIVLTSLVNESPSTEMMICQRDGRP